MGKDIFEKCDRIIKDLLLEDNYFDINFSFKDCLTDVDVIYKEIANLKKEFEYNKKESLKLLNNKVKVNNLYTIIEPFVLEKSFYDEIQDLNNVNCEYSFQSYSYNDESVTSLSCNCVNDGPWHAVNSAVNLNDGKNVICKMYLSLLSFLKIHHYKSFQPLLYNNLHYLTNVYIEKIDKKNGYIMYIDYLIFNFKKMKEKKNIIYY